MSWRVDSTSGELTSDVDTAERVGSPPPRPLLVEFGTAILVIGGAFGVLEKLFVPLVAPAVSGTIDPVFLLLIGLDVLSVVAGVTLRRGQTWVLGANVAAVYAFLHLAIPTPTGIVFSAVYLAVVAACFLSRDWFEALQAWRVSVVEARLSR